MSHSEKRKASSAVRQAGATLGIRVESLRDVETAFTNTVFVANGDVLARVTPLGVTTLERATSQMLLTRMNGVAKAVVPALHDAPVMVEDLLVAFWHYVPSARQATWYDVGKALRRLHGVTGAMTVNLPVRKVIPDHARDRIAQYAELDAADVALVQRMSEEWKELSAVNVELGTKLGHGVVHAEAHEDNVVVEGDVPLLVDVDELSLGAREIDLCAPIVRFPTIESGLRSSAYRQLSAAYGYDIRPWTGLEATYRGRRLEHLAYLLFRLRHGDATVTQRAVQRLSEYGLDMSHAERVVTRAAREARC